MKEQHTKATLMSWKKEELVEHIMCLEHNIVALHNSLDIQYKNCMQIVADMNVLNKKYNER